MIVLDFETEAIAGRPSFPPAPVGVAVLLPSAAPTYLSWGHPTGNNTTYAAAREVLARIVESDEPLLMHNAKFDLCVLWEGMGLPLPHWSRLHDTMLLLYLDDPRRKSVALKEAAAEVLGMPPGERDELAEWVWEHRKPLTAKYGGKITRAAYGPNSAGAWISRCPGDMVGRYAIGDVVRTKRLYDVMAMRVRDAGMWDAYCRERALLPVWLENERKGLRVDIERLQMDTSRYLFAREQADRYLRDRLGIENVDAPAQLADALERHKLVKPEAWVLTEKGQKSVAKDALPPSAFTDPRIGAAYNYRQALDTVLNNFMIPVRDQAEKRDGWVSTNWNSVKGGDGGTRTGRPSTSNPNFLNIAKTLKRGFDHPAFLDVPDLPRVRSYILPDDEDSVLIGRDFAGQELRVLAHFERGKLWQAYQTDAQTDPHDLIGREMAALKETTYDPVGDRTKAKILNFLSIYGGGAAAAAKQMGVPIEQAQEFKRFHDLALPGRRELVDNINKALGWRGYIRTWGGRIYREEAPQMIDGEMRDFKYKLINYLIQGSAADITKQTIIDWTAVGIGRFLLQVYDEILLSVPKAQAEQGMRVLREVMNRPRLSVPMLSDGEMGHNWGAMSAYEPD